MEINKSKKGRTANDHVLEGIARTIDFRTFPAPCGLRFSRLGSDYYMRIQKTNDRCEGQMVARLYLVRYSSRMIGGVWWALKLSFLAWELSWRLDFARDRELHFLQA
jgi:hypothetical protein